jgi:hypothetical protein
MAIQTAVATFTGAQDTISVVWPVPFASTPTVTAGIGVSDGQTLDVDVTGITTTGCTVEPTARFNGPVALIGSD